MGEMLLIFEVGEKYDNDHKIVTHDVCEVASMIYKVSITLDPNIPFSLLCERGEISCLNFSVVSTDAVKVEYLQEYPSAMMDSSSGISNLSDDRIDPEENFIGDM